MLKSSGVGKKDVIVASVDATQDAIAAMEAGDLDVTVCQSAKGQGEVSLETVLKIARGRNIPLAHDGLKGVAFVEAVVDSAESADPRWITPVAV